MSDKAIVWIHLAVATLVSVIVITACSKTVAIISMLVIWIFEAVNVFGVFYAVQKLPSHPRFIESASNQRLTELLMSIYLVATHLVDDDILRKYPYLEDAPSDIRDGYGMTALLRLFMFKLKSRGNADRALNIFASYARKLYPTPMVFVDSLVEYQNANFPGDAFKDLSIRRFGGNMELCMVSFVSLWLADVLASNAQDAPDIAHMLAPKIRQFIAHV